MELVSPCPRWGLRSGGGLCKESPLREVLWRCSVCASGTERWGRPCLLQSELVSGPRLTLYQVGNGVVGTLRFLSESWFGV